MSRRHRIAVLIGLLAIAAALVPPLWIRLTGDEVTLAIRPVDPLSLFRGNYVDLRYDAPIPPGVDVPFGDQVYVVFADERPARVLRVDVDRPSTSAGEFCLRGRSVGSEVEFPELEQFFVTPELGRELETNLSEMVAVARVTGGCRAVLVDIEPEVPAASS